MATSVTQHSLTSSAANATTVTATVTSTTAGTLLIFGCSNAGTRTVSGVTAGSDNALQCTGAASLAGALGSDVWYVLSGVGGVTSIVCTFSGAAGTFGKVLEVWEVSGLTGAAFDVAAKADTQTGGANTCNGATVTTATTNGFVVGNLVVSTGTLTGNPKGGNEFTSGGDTGSVYAYCSLISSTAAGHQPVWASSAVAPVFCTSTGAFKATTTFSGNAKGIGSRINKLVGG